MASPVVQVRVPGDLLARLDEARSEVPRSAWIVAAIEHALGPAAPAKAARQCPPHPKGRVLKGLCGACGTGGL